MNNWISVKDKLPDKNGKYLCYYKTNYFDGIVICNFATNLEQVNKYDFYGNNHCGWYTYNSEYGYCEFEDVTHWISLPEKPTT